MEQLNSAVHKYFLNVSMNKVAHHITIAADLQAVEFWQHRVTIIERRIYLILVGQREITQTVSRNATADGLLLAACVSLHFTAAQLRGLSITQSGCDHKNLQLYRPKTTCTVKKNIYIYIPPRMTQAFLTVFLRTRNRKPRKGRILTFQSSAGQWQQVVT